MPPVQDFILGLANQVVPHTGSWCPLATAVNYLAKITPIVYMAFQAQPASPVGVQLDSSMGRDNQKPLTIMLISILLYYLDCAKLLSDIFLMLSITKS
ncbi:hypothetical protein DSO57_1001625 [Entomophthora muscae]|uniref:Uncharacterized protein n=1 Tax=Entomophthora muscae TaxID=34485 RepID=A0ACC2RZW5_9FUNG|nr:hypothetical protein DSO57_1001625 [Entomophthora muscae]